MSELQKMLDRRMKINEGEEVGGVMKSPTSAAGNVYTSFPEFSRKQINDFKKQFEKYNESKTGYISEMELKRMMEKLGHPLTHIALKQVMMEIDIDNDGQVSFFEFVSIFAKSQKGELSACHEGLSQLVNAVSVDVSEVGVGGAKNFFEAKSNALKASQSAEAEIKKEQEEKKKEREEAAARKKAFAERAAQFGGGKHA